MDATFREELLKPVLDARHDTAGLERPWTPMGIAIATFFGGFLAGAVLFIWNGRRLGEPRKGLVLGLLGLLLFVGQVAWTADRELRWERQGRDTDIVAGAVREERIEVDDFEIEVENADGTKEKLSVRGSDDVVFRSQGSLPPAEPPERLPLGVRAAWVAFALLGVFLSHTRFRAFVGGGGAPGRLFVPGLIVVICARAALFGAVLAWMELA